MKGVDLPLQYYCEVRDRDPAYISAFLHLEKTLKNCGVDKAYLSGSTRTQTNLLNSDLDISAQHPAIDWRELLPALQREGMLYVGERRSTEQSSRQLFRHSLPGVKVDIALMPSGDFDQFHNLLAKAERNISLENRIEFTYRKRMLVARRQWMKYGRLKFEFYSSYFPNFEFIAHQMAEDAKYVFG